MIPFFSKQLQFTTAFDGQCLLSDTDNSAAVNFSAKHKNNLSTEFNKLTQSM